MKTATKTIRKRINGGGSISWQVDLGKIDGKRVVKSFKTRQEAEKYDRPAFKAWEASAEDYQQETLRLRLLNEEAEVRLKALQKEIDRLRSFRLQDGIPDELMSRVPEGRMVFELASASSGVYFLFRAGQLQYIGMSKDVPQRVARHRQNGIIAFDRVMVIPYAENELFEMESWWIKELRPPCNGEAPVQFQTQHCQP